MEVAGNLRQADNAIRREESAARCTGTAEITSIGRRLESQDKFSAQSLECNVSTIVNTNSVL